MSHFNAITIHENTPRKIDDYLSADIPQLAIHVVTFTDTTLITVTFLHTVFDAMGLRYFLQAWINVLSGAEDTIPPFLGFDEDTIEMKTEDVPPEQHVLSKTLFSRFQLGLFVFTSWWESYWHPEVHDRILSIPHSFVQRMREKALQELKAQSPATSSSSSEDIFISDGDVLLTLLSKTLITALNPSPSTPVLISNVFDIRAVLGIADTNAGVYTSNATMNACTPLDAATLTQNPISNIALRLRRSLDKQRAPGQVHAMTALRKKVLAETGYLPLVGVPGQISVLCTNWQRARFFELDFSAARTDNLDEDAGKEEDGDETGVGAGPCRPTYINTAGPAPLGPNVMRNMVCVTGRDGVGNWLLQVLARASAWSRIEEVIRELVGDV